MGLGVLCVLTIAWLTLAEVTDSVFMPASQGMWHVSWEDPNPVCRTRLESAGRPHVWTSEQFSAVLHMLVELGWG